MNGFSGDSCEITSNPKSVVGCATQCLDKCLKECKGTEIACYTNCSGDCNTMCLKDSKTVASNEIKQPGVK